MSAGGVRSAGKVAMSQVTPDPPDPLGAIGVRNARSAATALATCDTKGGSDPLPHSKGPQTVIGTHGETGGLQKEKPSPSDAPSTETEWTAGAAHSGNSLARGPEGARIPRTLKLKANAVASFGRSALTDAAAGQLDETPEFEGVGRAWGTARTAKGLSDRAAGRATERSRAGMGKTFGTRKTGPSQASNAQRHARVARVGRPVPPQAAAAPRPGSIAAAKGTATKTVGAAVASAAVPAAGVIAGVLAFVLAALMASQLMSALFGFWDGESQKQAALQGLPPYITYAMVEAALECQEDYGHPAGCTIAQIICESGMGSAMSRLAVRDHNLFGMKWTPSFAAAPEVAGKASWVTAEEYGGQHVTVTDAFTVFKSDVDCIRFRSRVFLQQARYAGNPLIAQAIEERNSDLMAEGLKDAGWATSSTYVEALKSVMDEYGLRRFDAMDAEDLKAGLAGAGGNAVVEAARSQLGVPYVWGGSTPYVGLDCSGLTQWCYAQAGIAIPRHSEAQAAAGTKLPLSAAEPGDILWRPGHVAIYIGGDEYIHEPMPGDVCRVATGIGYFTCAVRIG